MPKRYLSRPFAVEALPLTNSNVQKVAMWCGGMEIQEIDPVDSSKRFVGLNVPTLAGVERASEGDYIIRNFQGQFLVMKKARFEYEYEEA